MSGSKKSELLKKFVGRGQWKIEIRVKKILYNIFTTLSQQVLNFRLLRVFIGGVKKLF